MFKKKDEAVEAKKMEDVVPKAVAPKASLSDARLDKLESQLHDLKAVLVKQLGLKV